MHCTFDHVAAALALPEFDGHAAQQRMMPQARVSFRPVDRQGAPRQGAVLFLLYCFNDRLTLVLTRRRDDLNSHPGQVSLPGGQHEPPETLEETALRETYEEIGVPPEQIQLLGQLTSIYIMPSDFQVQPFVGAYVGNGRPVFVPDPGEVAAVLEAPLDDLLDDALRIEELWQLRGTEVTVPFFQLDGHKVWGATAMMLSEFAERLRLAVV
ncbi:MAG: CoA pyrophosphatase [Chloroflexota bacterium]